MIRVRPRGRQAYLGTVETTGLLAIGLVVAVAVVGVAAFAFREAGKVQ